ncbi:DNA topoisomerase III [Phocoenobacter skyensis]|uniref:DNA topoisomerase III n=1 Tax=Phocoenobacter skyensis TaxID=97481 RepID=UPI0027485B31|nr:DNA topoisomerase III [Pasteurella skyensis]MDP8185295.1 DNA topoisomerase III [Pasteurella skyensis]
MKLFLCEKPSQGRDIAKVLGATKRAEGYLSSADDSICVTWGVGHLVEQFSPEKYNPAFKKWQLETLPIIPSKWQVEPKKSTKKQYNVVIRLIKKAKHVIIATDIDREGETIARELLELASYKGPIQRLWLSALDDVSIRKALGHLKPNQETLPLYYAGLARSRADWLVGMNFSRLFTLLAQQKGYQGVMSVGRVQSPTLALVVNRDREIANFVPKSHYMLLAQLRDQMGELFSATYVIPEEYIDENGLCLNPAILKQVEQAILQIKKAKAISVETKRKKESPPLVFNLSTLQTDCNRMFGLGAKEVLDIAQSLYETHKATTYPRSDCCYLPEEQLAEVPKVINAVFQSDPKLQPLKSKLNLSQKSRVWNDKKITAHHGIIPTTKTIDIAKMSEDEFKVYDLIRRHYLAQFLPFCEIDKTEAIFESDGHQFIAKGNVTIIAGWKALFGKTVNEEEEQGLPKLIQGEQYAISQTEIKSLKTTPPPHFTEGTLLSAMVNAARFVSDERLKAKLRETEGLGTEATRAALIQNLFDKRFIQKKGKSKSIIATAEGVALIDSLPQVLKDPGMTALWEQALNQIAEGKLSLKSFMQKQEAFIHFMMKQCMSNGVNLGSVELRKCSECGKPMRKIKGEKGVFWGCTGYPNCKHTELAETSKRKRGASTNKRSRSSLSVTEQIKNLKSKINGE